MSLGIGGINFEIIKNKSEPLVNKIQYFGIELELGDDYGEAIATDANGEVCLYYESVPVPIEDGVWRLDALGDYRLLCHVDYLGDWKGSLLILPKR